MKLLFKKLIGSWIIVEDISAQKLRFYEFSKKNLEKSTKKGRGLILFIKFFSQ